MMSISSKWCLNLLKTIKGKPGCYNNDQGVMLNHLWLLNHRNKNHRKQKSQKTGDFFISPSENLLVEISTSTDLSGSDLKKSVTFGHILHLSEFFPYLAHQMPDPRQRRQKLVRCFKTSFKRNLFGFKNQIGVLKFILASAQGLL